MFYFLKTDTSLWNSLSCAYFPEYVTIAKDIYINIAGVSFMCENKKSNYFFLKVKKDTLD